MKRKVLITGAAGFIGSNLAEHLHLQGFTVVGCDLYNYRNPFFDVGDTHHLRLQKLRCDRIQHFLNRHQIEYYSVDLADHDSVFNLFHRTQPDVVVHLAAQAGVRNSVKAPMDFVKSNLNGFANVLDACKNGTLKNFCMPARQVFTAPEWMHHLTKMTGVMNLSRFMLQQKWQMNSWHVRTTRSTKPPH